MIVMVGGAPVTQEYADAVGAAQPARPASELVESAGPVLGNRLAAFAATSARRAGEIEHMSRGTFEALRLPLREDDA